MSFHNTSNWWRSKCTIFFWMFTVLPVHIIGAMLTPYLPKQEPDNVHDEMDQNFRSRGHSWAWVVFVLTGLFCNLLRMSTFTLLSEKLGYTIVHSTPCPVYQRFVCVSLVCRHFALQEYRNVFKFYHEDQLGKPKKEKEKEMRGMATQPWCFDKLHCKMWQCLFSTG